MFYLKYILNCILVIFRIFRIFRCNYDIKRLDNNIKYVNTNIKSVDDNFPKSIISWNIQELFLYQNFGKLKNIINYLKNFNCDIICLQEVFCNNSKFKIINELKKYFPFYLSGNMNKKYIIGEDSGILVLSKYPIEFIKEVYLESMKLPDKMANKTILYFRINNINFSTTHLQSDYLDISKKQINDIIKYSPFKNFIITGDINNPNMNNILNLNCNNSIITCNNLILDYIVPYNYNFNIETNVLNINLTNTSDHFPIYGEIKNI